MHLRDLNHRGEFYQPVHQYQTWRENPNDALRILALEILNGEHIGWVLAAIATTIGAAICAAL